MASREMVLSECEMPSFGAFFLKEARIFNGDTGFAGEHAKQLKMAFIEHALRIRRMQPWRRWRDRRPQAERRRNSLRANGVDAEFLDFVRKFSRIKTG